MKVENLTSQHGNSIANQFEITDDAGNVFFQSHDSVIGKRPADRSQPIQLDELYWDYSVTTGKYRNQWLGIDKRETERRIADGRIVLTNLN